MTKSGYVDSNQILPYFTAQPPDDVRADRGAGGVRPVLPAVQLPGREKAGVHIDLKEVA